MNNPRLTLLLATTTALLITHYLLVSGMMNKRWEVSVRVKGPVAADDPRVVALVKAAYLDLPSKLPYNLTHPSVNKYDTSYIFIMSHIMKFFDGQQGGFFVEAGAFDGETVSNSLWLEQQRGWTGLLIEPDPVNYLRLVSKHRKSWTSRTCLSTEVFPQASVLVSLDRIKMEESAGDRIKFNHRSSSHLDGVELETNNQYITKASDESYSVTQCFPLVSYLLALNVSTVDLLSLDIQGAEKGVLNHIPWSTLNLRVLVIENVSNETFDQEFVDSVRARGYVLVAVYIIDYVFVKQTDPVLNLPGVTAIS